MNDDHTLPVDRIGPLISWSKPHGWNSTLIVLSTCLEGKIIEYHLDSNDYSNVYQEAIKKSEYVEDFFQSTNSIKSTPPKKKKLLGPKSKRKSTSIKEDSDDEDYSPKKMKLANNSSSDEEYIPEYKKTTTTSKSRKRVHLARNSNDGKFQKYESDDITGSSSYFQQQMEKMPKILKSFDKQPGFGDPLAKLLPTEHHQSKDAIAAFILFVSERQKAWSNKRRRRKKLTSNQVLATKWFTNMYRELDRGTMYFRNCLNQTDLKGLAINKDVIDENLVKKVLFKSIVYRLINKVETFMNCGSSGMIPNENDFPQFLEFLKEKKAEGLVIFTAAHQNMGFNRLMNTFNFLQKNINTLSSNVVTAAKKRSIKGCQDAIGKKHALKNMTRSL